MMSSKFPAPSLCLRVLATSLFFSSPGMMMKNCEVRFWMAEGGPAIMLSLRSPNAYSNFGW